MECINSKNQKGIKKKKSKFYYSRDIATGRVRSCISARHPTAHKNTYKNQGMNHSKDKDTFKGPGGGGMNHDNEKGSFNVQYN